jgi:galactokinase
MTATALERATAAYIERFGSEPTLLTRAPGRVNIIGEHTDYNDGFALPMALPFDIVIAAAPTSDQSISAQSEGFEPTTIDLSTTPDPAAGWAAYVHGIAHLLAEAGHAVGGWQGCLASDIPAGASLSSSAALTMASGLAALGAAASTIDPIELALLGQRVENEVLGFPSGNLDQLASVSGRTNSASLIDCRSVEVTPVPLPDGIEIVIMDTGTRRELVDSEYAARRADCERAAEVLGVAALRDATTADLDRLDDDQLLMRARHVVGENQRTLDAAEAMRAGDAVALGELMSQSHASLRDDYHVTSPALDAISALAQTMPGCLGARMTGGGFAGGAVALVQADATDSFVAAMLDAYEPPAEQPAVAPVQFWPVTANAGAEILRTPS